MLCCVFISKACVVSILVSWLLFATSTFVCYISYSWCYPGSRFRALGVWVILVASSSCDSSSFAAVAEVGFDVATAFGGAYQLIAWCFTAAWLIMCWEVFVCCSFRLVLLGFVLYQVASH
ncbi:hypothetical protein U1Q18_027726 [Sarracenia purpurea var. burkii]